MPTNNEIRARLRSCTIGLTNKSSVYLRSRAFLAPDAQSVLHAIAIFRQQHQSWLRGADTTQEPLDTGLEWSKLAEPFGGLRARSHCRFAPPLIHFIPDLVQL